MSKNYGVELPEEHVLEIVRAWRKANPNITRFWYAVDDAVRAVLFDTGQRLTMSNGLEFDVEDGWLRIKLPSGRYLTYCRALLKDWLVKEEWRSNTITFEGVHPYTKQWCRLHSYGGRMVENLVQATARDVLAEGIKRAETHGYPPVLHIHDEIIAEVPDGAGYSHQELSALLATNPAWAKDLPLAAAGFETYRYRKDD